MSKEDSLEVEGKVVEVLPNAMFKVELSNGMTILAHISGRLRMNYIKILQGDYVKVEMSPYDLTRGRITWRGKSVDKSTSKSNSGALEASNTSSMGNTSNLSGDGHQKKSLMKDVK